MHGYLLMYCVYNTLCISLNWWIHLHPLENKNSLKSQSHISLAVPEAHMIIFSCFVEEWRVKRREEKGEEKKRETTNSFFKFHFLRNLSPEVKNECLTAKWNFQSMQINLPFANSYIWYAFYVEHLTHCFFSSLPLCLLN